MILRLLPGLYVCACTVALVAIVRRFLDPLPWRVALAMLALVVATFAPVLFGGAVLLPLDNLRGHAPFALLPAPPVPGNYLQGDLVTLIAPLRAPVRTAFLAGAWPLWNPLVGAGVPLLADPQAQPFSPLQLLALPLPLVDAAAVVGALRVLAAMLFTFLFLRRQRLAEGPAFAGALAWGLSGFVLLWLGWPLSSVGAFLPAALWAVTLALERGARRDLVALALASLALLLAGHPESELYAFVFVFAFAVARARSLRGVPGLELRRRAVRAAAATAAALLLALPVSWPSLHAGAESQRAAELLARRQAPAGTIHVASPPWERDWASFAVGRLLPLVAPNAFGNDRFGRYWGPENSNEDASGFVGSATVLLALLGAAVTAGGRARWGGTVRGGISPRARLRPQERLLQATVVVALAVIVLPPALRPWADRLPLMLQSTSYYHRLVLLVGFGLVALAACQLDRVERGDGARWPLTVLAAVLAGIVAWGVLAHPAPGDPAALDVLRFGWLRWHLRFLVATVAVVFVAWRRSWSAPAVAALVAAELLLVHAPANPPSPRELAFPRLPVFAALAAAGGPVRLSGLDGALAPNLASLYALADARAYDPMMPAACATALRSMHLLAPFADGDGAAPADPALDALGVRYLVAPPGAAPPAAARTVFADETATVFERSSPPVSALLAGDAPRAGAAAPGPAPSAASPALARVKLAAGELPGDPLERPGELRAAVCQDGGWRLLADGRPVRSPGDGEPLVHARLPTGSRDVALLYRPPRFLAGSAAGAAGACALLLLGTAPPGTAPPRGRGRLRRR